MQRASTSVAALVAGGGDVDVLRGPAVHRPQCAGAAARARGALAAAAGSAGEGVCRTLRSS